MVGVHLDLDLLDELGFHLRLSQLLLVDHLDGEGETRSDFPSHVHIAKSTLAQLPA